MDLQLSRNLAGALVLRDRAIDPQVQRDQPAQRLGQRGDIRSRLADVDEDLQQAIVVAVERDVDLALRRAHLAGVALHDLRPLLDATGVAARACRRRAARRQRWRGVLRLASPPSRRR